MVGVLKIYLSRNFFSNFLLIYLLVFCTLVHADRSTPKGTVIEVIKALKKKGSYEAVLNFIHWPSAFKDLRNEEKKAFNISSPNDLRKYLAKAVANPEQLMRKRFEIMLAGKSEEEKRKFNQVLDKQLEQIRVRQKQLKQKIKDSSFSIVGVKQGQDTAQVELKARFNNTSETKPLNLIKVSDKWYLTAASINSK